MHSSFRFAIIGGTHGNEFTGIEIIRLLQLNKANQYIHKYDTFIGNPKAYEHKKRYIDSDLNRSFGLNAVSKGYETKRSTELKERIIGQYDFLIDIHSTTTNMGLTIVLTRNDLTSLKAASYIQDKMPEVKLICTEKFNEECSFTTAMVPSGFIIEVGAVAHNVISAYYIQKVYQMLEHLLSWNFQSDVDLINRDYYKSIGTLSFPSKIGFYIHPHLEHNDFKKIVNGDPLFINIEGEQKHYSATNQSLNTVYPFFINEASYQELNLAMSLSTLERDLTKIDNK